MDSLFKTINSGDHGHPSENVLLLHVDGELGAKAVTKIRTHLDACWSCRVRTEKIEETISTFIDYRNQVLRSLSTPPPNEWRGFDGRLKGLVSEVGRPSVFANLRGALGRVFFIPNVSLNLGFLMRPIAVALILTLLVAVFLRFNRTSIVSASEMLQCATAAQRNEISKIPQAIVYQKLQVKRRLVSSSTSEAFTWEVWDDTVNSRTRRSIEDATGQHFLKDEWKVGNSDKTPNGLPAQNESTPTRLSSVLRANHMNPVMPLSAASYQTWSRSVARKQEEVIRTTDSDRHETLTLRTTVTDQVAQGAIAEASLVVRANDWHPIEERLRVKTDQGDEEFELVEAAYSVVSLSTLSPEIFKDQAVTTTPTSSPSAARKEAEASLSPLVHPVAPVVASADLEVEVLRLLNQVSADLGEQISANRHADGLVHVAGIVETSQRKAEILRALESVANNPAVKIEIRTVDEAVAAERQQRSRAKATPGPISEQKVEINNEAIATAPELRRHFASDEEVRQFALRLVTQSRSAMRHVFAMKRLVRQFTPDELRGLTPEAKNKWMALIRSHARAYQTEAQALRQALQPIFFPNTGSASGISPATGIEIIDDASLARAVDQLFTLASTNDSAIRAAFATTSENSGVSAIGSPQFSVSLTSAEALAARIARSN